MRCTDFTAAATAGARQLPISMRAAGLCVVFAGDWISLICFWEVMAIASWVLVYSGETRGAVRAFLSISCYAPAGRKSSFGRGDDSVRGKRDSVKSAYRRRRLPVLCLYFWEFVSMGIPPAHTWIPDAYPESTPAGTVYMGSFTTKRHLCIDPFLRERRNWLFGGAVMAVFGACMALIENDLRRLFVLSYCQSAGNDGCALRNGYFCGIDGATLHGTFNILYKGRSSYGRRSSGLFYG